MLTLTQAQFLICRNIFSKSDLGGRGHFSLWKMHSLSTNSLNTVHCDLLRNEKHIYHFWKSFLFSMAFINHSCHALWRNNWLFHFYYLFCQCYKILIDYIFVDRKRLTYLVLFISYNSPGFTWIQDNYDCSIISYVRSIIMKDDYKSFNFCYFVFLRIGRVK